MSLQLRGYTNTLVEVDATSRALLAEPRPTQHTDGHFQCAMVSGTMGAGLAAGSEIWQFRWTSSTAVALVRSVRLWAGGITAFTAGFASFRLSFATSFSAAGTGGNTATLTGRNGKLRTSMTTTGLNEIRCASTAALTAGTKTLDAQSLRIVGGSTTATAGTVILPPTELLNSSAGDPDYPVVLAQNEGLAIICTVPATGTWTFGVDVDWLERTTY